MAWVEKGLKDYLVSTPLQQPTQVGLEKDDENDDSFLDEKDRRIKIALDS